MENKYSRLQISIHWLVFLLVIAAYCAMEFRGFFPRSDRPLINMVHVSCGISILVLMVVRLLLRLKYPTPPIIQMCIRDSLNYLRVREWQDIYTQLRQVVKELGIPVNSEPAEYREIHIALLTGLLSHIGMKDADKQEYTGARNARFSIFPGSGLFKKPPKWVMVAELVETCLLYTSRCV